MLIFRFLGVCVHFLLGFCRGYDSNFQYSGAWRLNIFLSIGSYPRLLPLPNLPWHIYPQNPNVLPSALKSRPNNHHVLHHDMEHHMYFHRYNSASRAFIGINVPESRKYVAIYPVILYYFYMATILALWGIDSSLFIAVIVVINMVWSSFTCKYLRN